MIANRIAYGNTLIELAKNDERIVVLDADVGKSTGTLPFSDVFPNRYINCGIAEQNMIGVAAGLAACKKIPFVATFAVFITMRAVEQVRNAVCYPHFNVKLCGTHAGLETGADGATHQAIEDIAMMRSLPLMSVLVPSDPISTAKITRMMAQEDGPMYLRLGKEETPELYGEEEEFKLGGSKTLHEGTDACVMACGAMVPVALSAAKKLKNLGKNIRVIDMYSIKPIDEQAIVKAAMETKAIITIEDHSVIGGLGGAVAEVVTAQCPTRVIRMGLEDVFGRSGTQQALYEMFGLTDEAIVNKVMTL